MVRGGKLRNRITIQRRTSTRDEYGGAVESWVNVATVWAAVEPLSGRELVAAQAKHAEATTQFVIRYMQGIDATMRISYGGKNYNIFAIIDPNERHKELQILAGTGLNQG